MSAIEDPRSAKARAQDRQWVAFVERQRREGQAGGFEAHWRQFQEIFGGRRSEDGPPWVWQPDADALERSNLAAFSRERGFADDRALHRWSSEERAAFWEAVIERLGIVLRRPYARVLDLGPGVEDPHWLPGAELNIVESCFRAPAQRVAVVAGREGDRALERIRYRELQELAGRVAGGLRRLGLGPGRTVAIYMPLTLECVAAYLGAIWAGCRVASIADSFPPAELRRRLGIVPADLCVTADVFRRAGKTIELYAQAREAGAPRAVVVRRAGAAAVELRRGDIPWERLLDPSEIPEPAPAAPDATLHVLFSSGTTATPKAIPWTHLTPIKCAMDGHFHHDLRPGDVAAWPTSLGWMMGPWLIFASLINGATLALYEGAPTGAEFCKFVERAGVTMLGLVPSLVRAWRASGAAERADWSRVRIFSSTGEPSNVEDYLWLMSRTSYRAPVIEYCGGTEIGGGYITGSVRRPASPAVFNMPALGLDFVILDGQGRPVPEGDTGEVFIVPPSVGLSQRLVNREHHEVYYAGCPRGPHGETLRRHGDAMMPLPGWFWRAQGRTDDAMNLGGIKVAALELEQVLRRHDAVHECAAVAVPDATGGPERLAVYVVPARSAEREALLHELNALLARELNPLFRIHDLVFLDALPRTASNKLMRRELRDRYRRERS